MRVDPFTIEIIKEGLLAAEQEMFGTMARAAYSPIIYEVLDYATGITDAKGHLIAQGAGVTFFLGALGFSVQDVLRKFGDDIIEGDIYALNDPYGGGGTHLNDINLILPVFYEGTLLAFCVNKAHWTEVGGKDPGSCTTDATEIYQEGVQVPCIRICRDGKLMQSFLDLMAANVRLPVSSLGDMHAQVASLRVAGARIRELCAKYSLPTVLHAIEQIHEHGRIKARQALARLPKGSFEASDFMDSVGFGPIPVRVKVTITADEFIADFTGTGEQVPVPINCTRTALLSSLRLIWLSLTDPHMPPNEGYFEPLRLIAPDGTVFTARRPAPTSVYWESMGHAADIVWQALVAVLPGQLAAGHLLSLAAMIITTRHADTDAYGILVEPTAGGWGAAPGRDGTGALIASGDGDTYNIPVETVEVRYGLHVESHRFNTEEGGEGEFRGGRGIVREYRITHPQGGTLTGIFGRHDHPPWGGDGGMPGSGNYMEVLFADGRPPLRSGRVSRVQLQQGDLIRAVTSSGGGWGSPRNRPAEQVRQDVRVGLMSPQTAARIYGVTDHEVQREL